jgi:hypothetical protein
LIPELTVIAPLDSRLSILNPINHFSTHLRPAKAKPYDYTFALITLFHVHLHMLDHLDHHFMCISTSCDLGHHFMPHAPSSRVLLMPNSNHLTYGISNLVSLITKTKLELSALGPEGQHQPA